jgi:hypothetical protein
MSDLKAGPKGGQLGRATSPGKAAPELPGKREAKAITQTPEQAQDALKASMAGLVSAVAAPQAQVYDRVTELVNEAIGDDVEARAQRIATPLIAKVKDGMAAQEAALMGFLDGVTGWATASLAPSDRYLGLEAGDAIDVTAVR